METNNKDLPTHQEVESTSQPDNMAEVEEDAWAWDRNVLLNIASLTLCYGASAWSLSVAGGSVAFIMREYPENGTKTAWIAAGPSLCLCVIALFIGDISDLFGRKIFLLIGTGLGMTGLLLSGFSKNVNTIIGGQILNGIGMTCSFLATPLLTEVVPKRYRGLTISAATLFATGLGLAGQIGQGAAMKFHVLGEHRGWRIIFYIGAGLFASSFTAVSIFYKPGKRPNPEGFSTTQRFFSLDWIGIFVGTTGLVLTLLGLQFGGGQFRWGSPIVLSFIIIGCLLLVAFGIWEWKGVNEGLFPRSLFAHRNYGVTVMLNFVEGMLVFASSAFLPQITLALLSNDLIMAGVYNIPFVIATLVGAVVTAGISTWTRDAKWPAFGGVFSLSLGVGLMAVINPGISFAAWFFGTFFIGAGIGGLGVMIPVLATVCTPDRYVATAISIGSSVRGLGGALGVVMVSQIFNSKIRDRLPATVGAVAATNGIPLSEVSNFVAAYLGGSPSILEIPGATPELLGLLSRPVAQAYADSFRFIWYSLLPFCVVTLILALLLKTTEDQLSMKVAAKVQDRKHSRVQEEKANDVW